MIDLNRLFQLLLLVTLGATLCALGCRGGDDDDDDTGDDDVTGDDDDDVTGDDDDDTGDDYRHELTVEEPVIGDFSCLGEQLTVPTPGEFGPATAQVLDFSEDEPVVGAKALVWAGNDPSDENAADFEFLDGTQPPDGLIAIDDGVLQACSKFAYKVWTEWTPPETMPTYEMGNVLPPLGDPEWNAFEFLSVSYATYQIIPLSLAIQPDPERGIAAGAFYDCAGERVERAQVQIVDASGAKAENTYIRYFVDELPDRDQPWTSDDGLFGAIDVPPGAWTMELWGVLGEDMPECPEPEVEGRCKLAEAQVFVIPDSVNIANAYMVPYPEACYD